MSYTANRHLNLATLCRGDRLKELLHILLTTHNPPVQCYPYLQLLEACVSKKSLSEGGIDMVSSNATNECPTRSFYLFQHARSLCQIKSFGRGHGHPQNIMESGILSDVVTNALVDMYAKCGRICEARELFDKIPQKNVVLWIAMIVVYEQNGELGEAIRLFKEMSRRDAMIAEYAQNGFVDMPLEILKQMQLAAVRPNATTFSSILPACGKTRGLKQGVNIHQSIIKGGFLSDVVVANAMLDMYAKCGSMHMAREIFDKMPQREMVSWTAITASYAQIGDLDEALRLFKEMPQRNVISWNTIITGYTQNGFVEKALET